MKKRQKKFRGFGIVALAGIAVVAATIWIYEGVTLGTIAVDVVRIILFALAILIWPILCAALAEKKGRSPTIWAFVGVFLNLFGLILLLLLPPNTRELETQAVQLGEAKACPYCAEYIKPQAIVCRFCGRELTANANHDKEKAK